MRFEARWFLRRCRRHCLSRTNVVLLSLAALMGCEGGPQRVFDPASFAARELVDIITVFIVATTVPAAIVIGIALWRVWRRRRAAAASDGKLQPPAEASPKEHRRDALWVVGLGGGFTSAVIITLIVYSALGGSRLVAETTSPAFDIVVVGHQFWWEVRYPEQGVITANEIHLPVGQTVRVRLLAADVIHSFWVPQLHGKVDMIPGRENLLWLKADEAGIYRGQCAEFCGVQHALMAMLVVAEPPAAFAQWVDSQTPKQTSVEAGELRRGQQLFLAGGCPMCHAIRGVFNPGIGGHVGPDLTHLAGRLTLGAATVPLTRETLRAWVFNPHLAKPGVRMPASALSEQQLDALVTYLGTLK